jgi:hypothetical protein
MKSKESHFSKLVYWIPCFLIQVSRSLRILSHLYKNHYLLLFVCNEDFAILNWKLKIVY